MTITRFLIALSCAPLCACAWSDSNPSGPSSAIMVASSVNPAGTVLTGATKVAFTGSGTDPQNRALDFTWDFGDGASASGPNVTHVFMRDGTFNVVLTAKNARGDTATSTIMIQARSLNGRWTPLQNSAPGIEATITQSGSSISGTSRNSCCIHAFTGEVSDPRKITLVFRFSGCPGETRTFTGTVSADLNTIDAVGPNCNVANTTFGFTRPTS